MIEREVTVETREGRMPTFVAQSETPPPKGVVVMITDARGVRGAMRDHARRLAASGYYVMLPNLFYRQAGEGPIENVLDDAWMSKLNAALTNDKASADVQACVAFARADPQAPKGAGVGVMGYCMGGRLSVVAAQALGDQVAAVGSIHPGYMATRAESSPHRALDRIAGEVYFGLAEDDPHLSPGAVERLRQALDANGVSYVLEVVPGTGHGFSTPGNETYQREGAEHVWGRLIALFDRTLAKAPAGAA
ncbi:MAG: Dienelactone hydrolase [Phenylobacterium sp.]|nr:Dienelactone hydrolase [Phenylobacterium sp.]